MARKSSKHVAKNPAEKKFYHDYIKNQDYVPTVDESLKFKETTDQDKEFQVSENTKRRPKPVLEQIKDHISEHWVAWVIAVVTVVFSYFMVNSRVDIARIFEKTDNIEKSMDNISDDLKEMNANTEQKIDEIETKNHEQDIEIKENELRLEYSSAGQKNTK